MPFAVLALLLFIGLANVAKAHEKPHVPYHNWGACPFECCTYREWIAMTPVSIFKDRKEHGEVAFRLKKSERVRALTGVVVTYKVGITEVVKSVEVRDESAVDRPALFLMPKDILYTLHDAGEGADVFWYGGRTYVGLFSKPRDSGGDNPNSEQVRDRSRPEYVWWVKMRNHAGEIGWTRRTDKFQNKDACGS